MCIYITHIYTLYIYIDTQYIYLYIHTCFYVLRIIYVKYILKRYHIYIYIYIPPHPRLFLSSTYPLPLAEKHILWVQL